MRRLWAIWLVCLALPAQAGDRAGAFDYYILALSWNAAWCAVTGDARGADQCDPRHDIGFVLHGLWPQRERGWPRDCDTDARAPSRTQADAMADIMGSGGLAQYQWRKHGRCSGLGAPDYFALARAAYGQIRQPALLTQVREPLRLDPSVIEAAFVAANPGLDPAAVVVTCRDGMIDEVRVCLTKALTPRACSAEVARDCRGRAILTPMR